MSEVPRGRSGPALVKSIGPVPGLVLALSATLLCLPALMAEEGTTPTAGGEGFFEEEEEEERGPATAGEVGRYSLFLEYRSTDVFDPPPDPNIGPPGDDLYYAALEAKLNRMNTVRLETQFMEFDDEEISDSGWALLYWDKLLLTGARLGLEVAGQWDEDGNDGFWGAIDYTWAAGLNLDLTARVQGSSSLQDVTGWRAQLEGDARLTAKTAMELTGSYFADEDDTESWRIEAQLAQYLFVRTGLHVLFRRHSSQSDDPDAEIDDATSNVWAVGLKHRIRDINTLLRAHYRWYEDSEDNSARGFSVGIEQPFRRGSLGVFFRHYRTDEDIHADTWIITGSVLF